MQYSKNHDMMVYEGDLRAGDRALTLDGAKFANGKSYVPATLLNIQRLTAAKQEVVAPMRNYAWPMPQDWTDNIPNYPTLFDAEVNTANFIVANPICLVANELRTGKTPASLWACDYLMHEWHSKGCYFSVLILCKKSTMVNVWASHIQKLFGTRRTYAVLSGRSDERAFQIEHERDFYILNHDGVKLIDKHMAALPENIQMILVDESVAFKRDNTKRSKILYRWSQKIPHLCLMTGEPTPEGAIDAHGLGKLLRKTGGESYTSYKQRIQFRVSQYRWLYYENAAEEAAKFLQPYIRYLRADVLGPDVKLPPEYRQIEPTKEQLTILKTLQDELQVELLNGTIISAVHEGALRWKVLQTLSGVLYENYEVAHPIINGKTIKKTKVHALDYADKLEALKDIIEECYGRCIVYSGLSGVLNQLMIDLKTFKPELINGGTTLKKRNHILTAFNARETGPLLADPQAIAHGVDCAKGASTIVWFGPIDKAEIYTQANARIEGVNQTEATQVIHLYCTNFELGIYGRLQEKQSLQGAVLKFLMEGLT